MFFLFVVMLKIQYRSGEKLYVLSSFVYIVANFLFSLRATIILEIDIKLEIKAININVGNIIHVIPANMIKRSLPGLLNFGPYHTRLRDVISRYF